MHIYDEVTEEIAIMQQKIKESDKFTPSQKNELNEMLEEVSDRIGEFAE